MKMKQFLIAAIAAFALTSCLKSSPPAFQIMADVIFFQETEVTDVGNQTSYVPFVQIWSNDVMATGSCTHPNWGAFNLSKVGDGYWRSTYPAGDRVGTIPLGTFTITATSTDQSTDSGTISVTTTPEEMGNPLAGDLSYTSTTRELRATFNQVAGATLYGVYLIQGDYFLAAEVGSYTAAQMEEANWSIATTLTADIEAYANEYDLVIYAAKLDEVSIFQLGKRISSWNN
jgi:hypothetical protein